MKVLHSRSGKTVRLSSSHKLFGRSRETVNEAYPGDVIGIVGHSEFRIGDTLSDDASIVYKEVPRFPPEHFAFLHCSNTIQFKKFRAGLEHLLQEGVAQVFSLGDGAQRIPLLGAVGPLQFEVLQHRLQFEYGAETRFETAPWSVARWAVKTPPETLNEASLPSGSRRAQDANGNIVLLFPKEWEYAYFLKNNPKITLSRLPPEAGPAAG
jgi:peptide chain release factor 3